MTHDTINSNLKLLSSQFVQLSEHGLLGLDVFFDEIRSMAITAAEVSVVMKRIGSAVIVSTPSIDLLTIQHNDLEIVLGITCGLCCHCQSPPPRCLLSKRIISPKQFACKKYSPKYNSRK